MRSRTDRSVHVIETVMAPLVQLSTCLLEDITKSVSEVLMERLFLITRGGSKIYSVITYHPLNADRDLHVAAI